MNQRDLFDLGPPPAEIRPAWFRVLSTAGRCGATWYFGDTGWKVQHCGHPTAHRPYYVIGPDGTEYFKEGRSCRTPERPGSLRAFEKLADAKKLAESLALSESGT